jgi:hypothetical protein
MVKNTNGIHKIHKIYKFENTVDGSQKNRPVLIQIYIVSIQKILYTKITNTTNTQKQIGTK